MTSIRGLADSRFLPKAWASSGRWRTQKPDMLQSMGSQRVEHDWETEQQQIPFITWFQDLQLLHISKSESTLESTSRALVKPQILKSVYGISFLLFSNLSKISIFWLKPTASLEPLYPLKYRTQGEENKLLNSRDYSFKLFIFLRFTAKFKLKTCK